jgi:hypothetical protein
MGYPVYQKFYGVQSERARHDALRFKPRSKLVENESMLPHGEGVDSPAIAEET